MSAEEEAQPESEQKEVPPPSSNDEKAPPPADEEVPAPETNNESNANGDDDDGKWVDITGDGGVKKKILKEGDPDSGTPPHGSNVYAHYVGTLTSNGEKFDSSRDRDEPFNFPIGMGRVIRAWDKGIATMHKGERCILRCRSDYAYGEQAQGKIPANSDLDFDVELLDFDEWSDVNGKELRQKKIVKGDESDYQTPSEDGIAVIDYVARLANESDKNGNVFASGENIPVVVDDDDTFPTGFHDALKEMHARGTSEFKMTGDFGFGKTGNEKLGVPPDCPIIYRITLHSFINPKSEYDMSGATEHFSESNSARESGNKAFKAGKFDRAISRYERAIRILEHNDDFEDNEKSEALGMIARVRGNLSVVHLKRKDFQECIEETSKVIEFDSKNLKARVNRGRAYMYSGSLNNANFDFKEALTLDPANVNVKKLLAIVRKKIKENKQKEKEMAKRMFGGRKKSKKSKKKKKKESTKVEESAPIKEETKESSEEVYSPVEKENPEKTEEAPVETN